MNQATCEFDLDKGSAEQYLRAELTASPSRAVGKAISNILWAACVWSLLDWWFPNPAAPWQLSLGKNSFTFNFTLSIADIWIVIALIVVVVPSMVPRVLRSRASRRRARHIQPGTRYFMPFRGGRVMLGHWRVTADVAYLTFAVGGVRHEIAWRRIGSASLYAEGLWVESTVPKVVCGIFIPLKAFTSAAAAGEFATLCKERIALAAVGEQPTAGSAAGLTDPHHANSAEVPDAGGAVALNFVRIEDDISQCIRVRLAESRGFAAKTIGRYFLVVAMLVILLRPLLGGATTALFLAGSFIGFAFRVWVLDPTVTATRYIRRALLAPTVSRPGAARGELLIGEVSFRFTQAGIRVELAGTDAVTTAVWREVTGVACVPSGLIIYGVRDVTGMPLFIPIRAFRSQEEVGAARAAMLALAARTELERCEAAGEAGQDARRWTAMASTLRTVS
jgi:hypothetical protein